MVAQEDFFIVFANAYITKNCSDSDQILQILQNQSRKETTRLIRNRLPQKIFYRMTNCNITGQNQWQSYFTIKNKILEVCIKHS